MPGKHGMTKNKEGMPKNYKGAPKLSEKQAKHIDTNKDGKISGADFPINRMRNTKETDATAKGMPKNYNGMTKNFAMKNEMLSDSAKNGIPMQKNYEGMPNKYLTALKEAAKGSNFTTAKQRYNYSLKESKKKEEAEANANNTKK